jgi:hypothetical protein
LIFFLKMMDLRENLLPTQRIRAIQEELAGFLMREVLVKQENTIWRTRNATCNLVISM